MALTLSDVVDNRTSQRASAVRRDAAERLDAARGRRERFSLEDADRRADLEAQAQAQTRLRNAGRAGAEKPRADTSPGVTERPRDRNAGRPDPAAGPDAFEPPSARVKQQDARASSGSTDPAASEAEVAAPTDPRPADPDTEAKSTADTDASAPPAEEAPGKPPVESPATAVSSRLGTASKPPPGRQAAADRPGCPSAEKAAAIPEDRPAPETEAAAVASAGADGDEPAQTQESASVSVPVMPAMAVFAAPAAPVASLRTSATEAAGAEMEAASDIEGAGSIAKTSGSTAGIGSGRGATAKPGFEAALAEIASQAPAGDAAAASPSQASETMPAAPSGATETRAATVVQQPAQAAPVSPPVPLGAVPMTIGLRALGASNRFEIRLDPKELGRIDVSLDIDKDSGTVGARLVVDRPETLALLQRDAASLQQALAQTGLDASQGISLSLRGGESGERRGGSDPGADAQARDAGQTGASGIAENDRASAELVPLRLLRGLGRIDIRI